MDLLAEPLFPYLALSSAGPSVEGQTWRFWFAQLTHVPFHEGSPARMTASRDILPPMKRKKVRCAELPTCCVHVCCCILNPKS